MSLADLFDLMIENKASDLHLTTGAPPLLRIRGDLIATVAEPLTMGEVAAYLAEIMDEEQREQLNRTCDLDMGYDYGEGARFRVNAFVQKKGPGAVFRLIPTK